MPWCAGKVEFRRISLRGEGEELVASHVGWPEGGSTQQTCDVNHIESNGNRECIGIFLRGEDKELLVTSMVKTFVKESGTFVS